MKKPKRKLQIAAFAVAGTILMGADRGNAQSATDTGWPNYANDTGGTKYSPAKQIDRSNVAQLKIAWTYHTEALGKNADSDHKAAFEATPILVDGKLYLSTPYDHVIALKPESGEKFWEFDPGIDAAKEFSEVTSRGVAAWHDAKAKTGQACALRIFIGTVDARLIAIDGSTGKLCKDFGASGQVDLTKDVNLRDVGQYQVTSSPTIAGDVVITGSSIGDNRAVNVERGIVRGFDVRTGKQLWSWDPIPWATNTTPRTGAANAWSTIAADSGRGIIYVPTGSASPDYYGGIRKGDNKWANSVVALKAASGELLWGFQVVHHDLWDYDVASQPTLFTWKDGTPAIAITTKMGRVFVLNRLTGAPLIPIVEKPAPKSDVAGEDASPTQPSSISAVPETLTAEGAWGKDAEDKKWCTDKIQAARAEGIFTPPSLQGSIVFPGSAGGVNWGGSAYDPERHLLVMDTNRLPFLVKLIARDDFEAARKNSSSEDRLDGEFARQTGAPYAMYRSPLLSPSGSPCNRPPWGTVTAVDLFTGTKVWDAPLGSYVQGFVTGTVNLGGPMATGGGLIFTAAGADEYFHAYDSENGKELWSFQLPAGGQAAPMTYIWSGKQYVVIAAGGHGKLGTKQGDSLLAFTLP